VALPVGDQHWYAGLPKLWGQVRGRQQLTGNHDQAEAVVQDEAMAEEVPDRHRGYFLTLCGGEGFPQRLHSAHVVLLKGRELELYSISRSPGHCRGPCAQQCQRPDKLRSGDRRLPRAQSAERVPEEMDRAGADCLRQRDDVRALLDRRVRSLVVWAGRLVLPARVYRYHADSAWRDRLQECDEVLLGAAVTGDQQRRGMDLARWRRDVSGELAPRCVKPGW